MRVELSKDQCHYLADILRPHALGDSRAREIVRLLDRLLAEGPAPAPAAPVGPHFDGETYDPVVDWTRLSGQFKRVWDCMIDGEWRTLQEISNVTGDPQASISARLRDMRKRKFGTHDVDRRRRGKEASGLWEYRLEANMGLVACGCGDDERWDEGDD